MPDHRVRTTIRHLQAAPLIFRDRKRLAALLNDPVRPVQLVFAGGHPRDERGQAFARTIFEMSLRPSSRARS